MKKPVVGMGCYQGTIKEWEADFWNSDESNESNERFECFQTIIRDYEGFKNNKQEQNETL